MDTWKYENLFYLTSKKSRLLKLIDQYEIYKKILNVKGDIVECGVFKGASLIRLATFRDLIEDSQKRKILGFDSFGKFPMPKININKHSDINFAKRHDKNIGIGIAIEKLRLYLKKKKIKNFDLIKGNVINTIPKYFENKKNKIALLHLDLDIYEPTEFVLNYLVKRIPKGGVILLDDYNHIKGATLATDNFIKNNKLKIKKVSKKGRPSFIQI